MSILSFVDTLIANSTPDVPAWNVEHTLLKKETRWNYVDGCMMKAVMDLHYATGKENYFDFVKSYIDFFVDADGGIATYDPKEYNCDHINMGKVLFDMYRKTFDERYKKALDLIYSQLTDHPRTKAGNFWHKLIYPNQVWLDGLYMVQPFYAEYDKMFFDSKYFRDVYNQFRNVRDIMRDPFTGLYYHGYDESREMFWADKTTGLSSNFWTRSIGWLAMAIVDTVEKLNEQYNQEAMFLKTFLKELLDTVLFYRENKTKLYYQVTNAGEREGNYLETSGSAAIAYSMMKGNRLGYLLPQYYDWGKEIFDSLVEHKLVLVEDRYVLKDVCLVAGLGGMPGQGDYKLRDGTFEYYVSEPRVNNDAKGLAPFLFGYAEVLRNNIIHS